MDPIAAGLILAALVLVVLGLVVWEAWRCRR
jgi:hypothetical protein